jgi:hypothetical protein
MGMFQNAPRRLLPLRQSLQCRLRFLCLNDSRFLVRRQR